LFTLVHKDEDQLSSLILRRPWNVKKSFLLSSFSKWTVKNNEIKTKIDSSLFNVQIKDPLPLQAVGCKKNLPSRTFSQNIFFVFFFRQICVLTLLYMRAVTAKNCLCLQLWEFLRPLENRYIMLMIYMLMKPDRFGDLVDCCWGWFPVFIHMVSWRNT